MTTVNTPGTLSLSGDTLHLATQTTQNDTSVTSEGRDVVYQKAKGDSTSAQTTNYNQFNDGKLAVTTNHLVIDVADPVQLHNGTAADTGVKGLTTAGAGAGAAGPVTPTPNAKDSMLALSTQPGMGWVSQLANDPKLVGKIDWAKVEEAHNHWDYAQQGLTTVNARFMVMYRKS